jgi:hypothetical protein
LRERPEAGNTALALDERMPDACHDALQIAQGRSWAQHPIAPGNILALAPTVRVQMQSREDGSYRSRCYKLVQVKLRQTAVPMCPNTSCLRHPSFFLESVTSNFWAYTGSLLVCTITDNSNRRGADAPLQTPALITQRADLVQRGAHLARERVG